MTLLNRPTTKKSVVERPKTDVSAEMPTKDEIVQWLHSLRISIWGTYFLMEKERPQDCADWILAQIQGFLQWRELGRPDLPIGLLADYEDYTVKDNA